MEWISRATACALQRRKTGASLGWPVNLAAPPGKFVRARSAAKWSFIVDFIDNSMV
jgi:hypothetical protein